MLRFVIIGTLLAVMIGFSTVNTVVLIVTILTVRFYYLQCYSVMW
jgi:hypothetical protein